MVLYAQPAWRVVQLNPDVVEYVDVARRWLAGEGYLLGVKAYHFGGTDVLHDGLAERPPLFVFLVAAVLWLGFGLHGVQLVNVLLAATCVGLVAAIAARLFGQRVGLASGLLAAASPVLLARLVPPMSEALATGLVLGAVWLVLVGLDRPPFGPVRSRLSSDRQPSGIHRQPLGPDRLSLNLNQARAAFDRPDLRPWLAAGALLGLGYVTRPTSAVALPAILLGVCLAIRLRAQADRWSGARATAALLLAALLPIASISVYSLVTRGTLSYSGQTYLYAVYKDSDVLRNGFGPPLPTARDFIASNTEFVVAAIVENARDYGFLLFADRDWLRPLALGAPLAFVMAVRGAMPRAALVPLLVALANFAVYAVTWANYQERYQIVTLLLVLPFLVAGFDHAFGLVGQAVARAIRDPIRATNAASAVPSSLLAVLVIGVAFAWSPTFGREYGGEFRYGDEPVRSRDDAGLRWTGPPRWVQDADLSKVVAWIDARTAKSDVLAHREPWPFTFLTGRPATLLPTKLTPERLREFVVVYRVSYVLLDTRDRDRRIYADSLERWQDEGVTSTDVGSHAIFDTRPLWAAPSAPLPRQGEGAGG